MKYWFDTEFIEDGKTIDLISIGIVAEDGRELYLQNCDAKFKSAGDFVWRNVFPSLTHFSMTGDRSCTERSYCTGEIRTGRCYDDKCVWASHSQIRERVREFCDVEKFGKPEFWGYFADYDWVAFCQLFGTMMELPKGFPFYCRDIKQLCDSLGNPKLPEQGKGEHNALLDARWNKLAHEFLLTYKPTPTPPL